jgi:C-5 cytosine-specific DNA methylase
MEKLTPGELSSRASLPICYDLYCGLGGWAEGFLSEGFLCIGYDIEKHDYGTGTYPGELILADVRSIHGSQLRDATCIVASPPCQEPSYRAMPWKRAKALNAIGPPHNFIELFNACFRIQREANESVCCCACWRCTSGGHCVRCDCFGNTGRFSRYIPLVVENVVGAQRWVGKASAHYGSFYLWGDVWQVGNRIGAGIPRLGNTLSYRRKAKVPGQDWNRFKEFGEVTPHWRLQQKNTGGSWFGQRDGQTLYRNDPRDMRRNENGEWVNTATVGGWNHPGKRNDGVKGFTPNGERLGKNTLGRKHGSRSKARKAASAEIAKIPFPLAQWIARCYKPSLATGHSPLATRVSA